MECTNQECKNTTFRLAEVNIEPRPTHVYFIVCEVCGTIMGTYENAVMDRLDVIEEKLDEIQERISSSDFS
jgi:transcription elongation factor Elf1